MYNNYTSIEQSETLVMLGMKADTSDANYYYVDGNWVRYENGKKTIDSLFSKR